MERKMKQFYGDIIVIEKRRIRVDFEAKKKPNKTQMMDILQSQAFHDITDEENLNYLEVVSVDVQEVEEDSE